MHEAEKLSLDQIQAFLQASQTIRFEGESRPQVYHWIEQVLCLQQYHQQSRGARGLIRLYLAKMTGPTSLRRSAASPPPSAAAAWVRPPSGSPSMPSLPLPAWKCPSPLQVDTIPSRPQSQSVLSSHLCPDGPCRTLTLILRLLLEDRFPQVWVPNWENRDLRQLLWHRHRMVQARTRIMNQLQAVALNEGLRCKKRLWRDAGREQLESFALAPWATRRRRDLLELLDRLTPTIAELTQAIEQEVENCPEAQRLHTHPGVGALTALAFVLIIGRPDRFQCGKQIASYLGLVPLEESSGQRRRLGHITKQGNSLLRFLLVEAAQVTVRSDPEWRSKYFHLAMRRGRKIAKVAMARRLAVRMYWMWRKGWDYEQMKKFGSHAGQPGTGDGV